MSTPIVTIDKVLPWGRSFEEYVRMFHLSTIDLDGRILCCADGPAAFNAMMTELGKRVVSVDPMYNFSREEIASRVEDAKKLIVDNTLSNMAAYNWEEYSSLDELVELRLASVKIFLADYDGGKAAERYMPHALPDLPFCDASFDLALCSHFLFTYTRHFDTDFHLFSIVEMARAAKEVRVFPLLDMDGEPSPHLAPVFEGLKELGLDAELRTVPYEFQKGGNTMLVARSQNQ